MELVTEEKKGFKKTEVGLIPEDWEIKVIDQLTSRVGDGIHATPNYDESGPYYFINGNNLANGKIHITEATKKVSEDEYKIHKRDLSDTTILLSINGTIGNVAFYRNEPVLLGKSAAYINIVPNAKKEYLFYQLQTEYVQEYFYNNLTGTTIKNLGLGTIRSTPIPLPPTLEEQQAIADALSDVDELIRSLDALIEKKEAIKKGVMQQLLTGKKRLPGFDGEWEVKKLGDLAEVKGGKRLPKGWSLKDEKNNHPYIRVADMYSGGVDFTNLMYVPEEISSDISNYRIYEEDLFISVAGTLGIVGEVPKKLNGANLTENADRLTSIKCDKKYLLYYLLSPAIQDAIKESRTLGAQPKLAIERIKQFDVFLSNDLSEQKDIAQILSDMDEELQTLRQKRDKMRRVKEGMMQELLTGKTRLV